MPPDVRKSEKRTSKERFGILWAISCKDLDMFVFFSSFEGEPAEK